MNNEKILIHVKRSKRRTISVTVGYYGDVLVHAPLNASREDISKFLNREKEWILKRVEKDRQHERQPLLTEEEIAYLEAPYVPHPLAGVMAQNKPAHS